MFPFLLHQNVLHILFILLVKPLHLINPVLIDQPPRLFEVRLLYKVFAVFPPAQRVSIHDVELPIELRLVLIREV